LGTEAGGRGLRGGLGLGGHADLQRIDLDRLGDVLELGRAEIGDREIVVRHRLSQESIEQEGHFHSRGQPDFALW
jgi:hypothetical protein